MEENVSSKQNNTTTTTAILSLSATSILNLFEVENSPKRYIRKPQWPPELGIVGLYFYREPNSINSKYSTSKWLSGIMDKASISGARGLWVQVPPGSYVQCYTVSMEICLKKVLKCIIFLQKATLN